MAGVSVKALRVGLLWRLEWDRPRPGAPVVETCRLHGVFEAFAALGIAAEPVIYSDDEMESVREQLLKLDGVLVWVNPIEQGLDRSKLDSLLRRGRCGWCLGERPPGRDLEDGNQEGAGRHPRHELGDRHLPLPVSRRTSRTAPHHD